MQGVSREKVNVLEGDSICHCKNNFHINMYQILNGYLYRAFWIYKYKSIVTDNKEINIT
jgi:hypothetical protein